jgi:predicted outer membrane protein
MRTSLLLAAAVALASIPALADERDTTPATTTNSPASATSRPGELRPSDTTPMKHDATAAGPAAMGKESMGKESMGKEMFTPEMVLNKIHAINVEELAGAKLAKANGDRMVSRYADRMMKDHGQAEKELMTLAEKKNVTVHDPMSAPKMSQMDKDKMAQDKAMMDQMKTQRGAAFDHGYLTMMSTGHGEALDFLKQAQDNLDDKEVKSFVAKLVPVVTEHKKLAEGLLKSSGKVQGRR